MHKLTLAAVLLGVLLAGCNKAEPDRASAQNSGVPIGSTGAADKPASSPASDPSLPDAAKVFGAPASSAGVR